MKRWRFGAAAAILVPALTFGQPSIDAVSPLRFDTEQSRTAATRTSA
jgi:hypothetical protein